MKNFISTSLMVAALMPGIVLAIPAAGDREITLSGAGSSSNDFDNTGLSLDGSFAKYLSPQSAIGIRQSINVSNADDNTDFTGSTRLFYDYHFGLSDWRPFVGVNLGGLYGDNVDDTFAGGPELGLKYYVNDKTFIMGMMEYQFFFKNVSEADNRFKDGAYFYSIGLGFNF